MLLGTPLQVAKIRKLGSFFKAPESQSGVEAACKPAESQQLNPDDVDLLGTLLDEASVPDPDEQKKKSPTAASAPTTRVEVVDSDSNP